MNAASEVMLPGAQSNGEDLVSLCYPRNISSIRYDKFMKRGKEILLEGMAKIFYSIFLFSKKYM